MEENANIRYFKVRNNVKSAPSEWGDEMIIRYMNFAFGSSLKYVDKEFIDDITPRFIEAFKQDYGASLSYTFPEGMKSQDIKLLDGLILIVDGRVIFECGRYI